MKNELVKKVLPHLVAIIIFLLVAILFCKPALEGNVLGQDDIMGWKSMAQNGFDYKERTGHFPLWNPNLFSGMPNYLIVMDGKTILPDLTKVFSLGLPQPISFFFIAAVCFYILCMALRVKPVVGIFGGLGFAFCTFHPAIIIAGHVTQMFAIAYSPLLLAGILIIYDRKYWLGLAVATLGIYLQILSNHPQISYYLFIIVVCITIGYLVEWIKAKDFKHIGIAFGIAALAGIAGVMANSLSFLVTTEYARATMRGGKSVSIQGENVQAAKTTGLDTSYAFQYSVSKPEPLVIFMPKVMGGGSRDVLGDAHAGKVVSRLADVGVPEDKAEQAAVNLPSYWGGLEFAGNLTYIGVLVFLLALIGFVVIRHPLRWGLLAATLLSVMMAWGKFFPSFNIVLFEHLPLYNKFRAPSMALVITEITLPIVAMLATQQLFFTAASREWLSNNYKKILYTVGGLVAFLILVYLFTDFVSPHDNQLIAQFNDPSGNSPIGNAIQAGLKSARSAMFGGQLVRTVIFIVLLLGLFWAFVKKLNPLVIVCVLAAVNIVDLLVLDKDYLNDDSYHSKDELQNISMQKTPLDEAILRDKDLSYRVFNYGQESFSSGDNHFPTFHKTIGGYHPAKLRIYQDILERYLYNNPNQQVLNMLNAKYIVADNPQTKQKDIIPNAEAYGPVWLVKAVKIVKDDVTELQSIGMTNLNDTAIVNTNFAKDVTQPQWDSTASITLSKFDNDVMEYSVDARAPQFAVFSEVYYPYGWNVYLDGKTIPYVKANYVLRGLSIPGGKHTIKFAFEPATYKKGLTLAYTGSWLVLIFVLSGFFLHWFTNRKKRVL